MYKLVVCPLCSFEFKQEKRFYEHLLAKHAVDDPEQLYIEHNCDGKAPTCRCSEICNKRIKWSGWKQGYTSRFVRGHNAKVESSFKDPEFHRKATQKRAERHANGTLKPWNDGLTKETDERVAKSAEKIKKTINDGYETGRLVDWRTKDPEKAKDVAAKISCTKRRLFADRTLMSWNEGMTKETDASVMSASKKIRERYASNRECGRRLSNDELLKRMMKFDGIELITPLEEYRNKSMQTLLFRCVVCGSEFSKTFGLMENCPKCNVCHPKASKAQLEIFNFIKEMRDDAVLSDRTLIAPSEIDVLVPGALAVEYNGLWWHSERFLPKDYATKKLRACQRVDIPLFNVYEDEWRDKRLIVEAMLRHRLGVFCRRVGARECNVIELSTSERREFFNSNHIDGDVPASIAFALKSGNDVVAAMSIRRPMHSKHKKMLEIARFCVLRDVSVPGALSRLAAHADEHRKEIGAEGVMTYVDGRLGAGKGYEAAGFKLVSETAPRFHWTDFSNRFNRFMFRADAERKMSEAAVAAEAGVVKMWGCPNLLFVRK